MEAWQPVDTTETVVGFESISDSEGGFSENSLRTLYKQTQYMPSETDVGILLPKCAVRNVLQIQGKAQNSERAISSKST